MTQDKWAKAGWRISVWSQVGLKAAGDYRQRFRGLTFRESFSLLRRDDEQANISLLRRLFRTFSPTAELENLEASLGLILWLRCQCAIDFLATLSERKRGYAPLPLSLPEGYEVAELVDWLMLELWERCGENWLKLMALELSESRA